jgi:hypothetical protein
VKPGGLVFISVENLHGSVLADSNITQERLPEVMRSEELRIPNDTYTRYFTRKEFENLVRGCGLSPLFISGCQWTADGPLHRLVEMKKLPNAAYRKKLAALEKLCSSKPWMAELPRLWLGIGKVIR